jgi:hypothetical protein
MIHNTEHLEGNQYLVDYESLGIRKKSIFVVVQSETEIETMIAELEAHVINPVQVVIQPISPRQIRQALTATNLRQSVEAAIAAGTQDLKDWWEYSTSFERLNPEVIAMGTALGKTSAELDALWLLGSSL